jgi:short subunit dehydrogenase-like uncharacterized protein
LSLGLEYKAFALEDAAAVDAALLDVAAVLHCAGPFSRTSKPMVEACLRTQTHYLDITGEVSVFEATRRPRCRGKIAGSHASPWRRL